MNLVDLAGSERVNEHEGNNSEATGETGYINKSLFVLGNVIHKLSEGKKFFYYNLVLIFHIETLN